MMVKGLASIPLPCFHRKEYLEEALDSCLSQDNIEIIAVNDGDSPETWPILKAYAASHHNVYAMQLHRHVAENTARNFGIRASRGEFIVYMDSDDIMTPDSVKVRREAFEPRVDIVCGYIRTFNANTQPKEDSPKLDRGFPETGLMIRRRVFRRLGLFYDPLVRLNDCEWYARVGLWKNNPKYSIPNIRSATVKSIDYCCCYWRRHAKRFHKAVAKDEKQKELFYNRLRSLRSRGLVDTEFLP